MAFNALSTLFGWTASKGRSRAALRVTTSGGDAPADSTIQNDAAGLAWAEVVADAPIEGATAYTVGGADIAAGRQFVANMTVSGAVVVKFLDTTTLTLTFPVGFTVLPWAITAVVSNAGTGTFARLK